MSLALELLAGLLIAGIGVAFVLEPVLRASVEREEAQPAPSDVSLDDELTEPESPRALAIVALREIEFDRETGKLDEADYRRLKAQYTGVALEAMRAEGAEEAARAIEPVGATVEGSDDLDALAEARIAKARAQVEAAAAAPPAESSTAASSTAAASSAGFSFVCPTCGPRPERDATFCSKCGRRLAA